MVASSQVKIPFQEGIGRQRLRGISTPAKDIGRSLVPFFHKNVVPAAKRVGADSSEFAAPEIAEVVSGRKNVKTAAISLGRHTLRKQMGSGSKRRFPSRVIPTKFAKQISRSRTDFFTNIS